MLNFMFARSPAPNALQLMLQAPIPAVTAPVLLGKLPPPKAPAATYAPILPLPTYAPIIIPTKAPLPSPPPPPVVIPTKAPASSPPPPPVVIPTTTPLTSPPPPATITPFVVITRPCSGVECQTDSSEC